MTNLKQRVITGAIFGIILIGSILLSPVTFFILFFIITLLSILEFYRIVKNDSVKPQTAVGTIISVLVFIYFTYLTQSYFKFNPFSEIEILLKTFLFIFILLFLVFIIELYRKSTQPFVNIALTIAGIIYIALPFSFISAIAFYPSIAGKYHPTIILGILFLLWANDTGAYFSGMRFGKHKLFERHSPKKTWEGSIGGTAAALLTGYIISFFYTELKLTDWLVLAIIIVVTGTLGDLVESMLKRSLNLKDSGNILPGHGGMLDRFDGLLGAAPFIFFYLFFFERL